jgi:hypothetical protein
VSSRGNTDGTRHESLIPGAAGRGFSPTGHPPAYQPPFGAPSSPHTPYLCSCLNLNLSTHLARRDAFSKDYQASVKGYRVQARTTIRAAAAEPAALSILKDSIEEQLIHIIMRAIPWDDAELRASFVQYISRVCHGTVYCQDRTARSASKEQATQYLSPLLQQCFAESR